MIFEKPQICAETRRKPQIGVCPLRFVPLSAALSTLKLGLTLRLGTTRAKLKKNKTNANVHGEVSWQSGLGQPLGWTSS